MCIRDRYITESCEFYGREYFVNNNVLIPRPETERLVEIIIESVGETFNGKILDLGSGTGAIVLALCNQLKEKLGNQVYGIDPEYDQADEKISWEDYEPTQDFNVFLCR